MKKIVTFLFAAISLSLSAQDCLNFPDTTFVCGFETLLPTTDFSGTWTYLCDESAGTVAMGFDLDGNTEVKISECGEYYFSFSASSPDCTETDTIMVYFDDPSTNSNYGSAYGSLEYGAYGCHNGGSNCATGGGPVTISISGASPPTTDWEFNVTGGCSSTNYLTEVVNASSDNCEADDILVITVEAGDLDTVTFTAPEDYVLPQIQYILDSLQVEFANSLADNACQLLNSGCPSICMDNPEMEGDTIVFDTIQTIIPYRVGGNWSLIIGDSCLILEDSTVFAYNDFVNLRLIVAPGADYYGPSSISWSLEQEYINTAGDTIYGGIQGNYDLIAQWKEFFEYDTITNIVQHTIPDLICNGCGGNFYGYNETINPEPPVYDCGPIFLSFYFDECICNPPFVFANVQNDISCAEACTDVEFITDAWAPFFTIYGPEGVTNTSDFSFSACEAGTYDVEMITEFGCQDFTSFVVIGDFEEFESSFNEEVCEGTCYNWNGQDYCASGTYEQTLIAERNGCDSIVTLNLLVNPPQVIFESHQVCFGETYNGYPAGTHIDILQEQCLVINLTVEELPPSPPQNSTAVICSGECYFWNGQNYCSAGIYNITETDQNGCSYESNLVLVEELAPNVSLSVSNEISCAQPVAIISSIGGFSSISWSTGGSDSELIVSSGGTYSAMIVSENGCVSEVSAFVSQNLESIYEYEEISLCSGQCFDNDGIEICETSTVTSVSENPINGCDIITEYQITVEGIEDVFQTETVCPGADYQGYSVGEHEIEETDANGCVSTIFLTVIENSVQNTQESLSICNGECVDWNGATYCESGLYTNSIELNGCVVLQDLILTVAEEIELNQTEIICPGEDYEGYSAGEYTIEDTVNGCPVTVFLTVIENTVQNTQESLSLCNGECTDWNGVTYCESGTYTNTMQENGCTVTQELILNIDEEISYEITVSNDIDCDNETVTLSVPNQTGTYQWSTGETGNSITVDAAGEYSVVYVSENNCTLQEVAVVEETIENNVLEEILYICPQECIMVNGQEVCEAGTYTNVVGDGPCTTTFISEVRQMYAEIYPTIVPSLDCDNNQGTLYLGFTNEWSAFLDFTITYPDGNIIQTTEMPLVNNITQGGTYEFVGYYYSANGSTCETSLTLEIEDNSEQIEVSMSGNPEISCLTGYTQAETSILNGYNYNWSGPGITSDNQNEINPQLTEAGNYTLTVSNPNSGCSTQSTFTVLPQPEIEVSTAIEEQISCQTGYALPQTTVYSDYDYVWSGSGISADNMNEINPELSQAGTYNVTVTNPNNGCIGTAEITVLAQTEITALAEADATCEDSAEGQATVTNVSGGAAPYLYSIDGENWQTEAAFTNLEIGDYILQIQDVDNCETEVSASVGSLPGLPEIEVEISEFSICGTQEVVIDASVPQSENLNYLWSDGTTDAVLMTSISGDYEVEISNICASETITYSVESVETDPTKYIFVPDAFSPNSDSNNEVFKGYFGKEVVDYQFRVYDRWGNLVFNSTNPDEGWDGSKQGQKLINGVYIWQMMVKMEGCEEAAQTVDLSGDVLLFR